MVPTRGGKYEYRPDAIVSLRKRLKQTQAELAKDLGVPPNTLSRWETGATTPDAQSLAALYSLGAAEGAPPQFFQRKRLAPKPGKGRPRLLVMWDFQNAAVRAHEVQERDARVRSELDKRFASSSYRLFKAFATPAHEAATDVLADRGWRVWEDSTDMDGELIAQARSDCGHEPKDTTFVLIGKDGDYADLVTDLKEQGVLVHLLTFGPPPSEKLVAAVGKRRWIQIN